MTEAIGVRLDDDFLRKIDRLSKEDLRDRSSTIRKLLDMGYKRMVKEKAAEEYKKGNITMSEAARRAEITVWEMQRFLVEKGFVSSYSIEDLSKELKLLR